MKTCQYAKIPGSLQKRLTETLQSGMQRTLTSFFLLSKETIIWRIENSYENVLDLFFVGFFLL